MSACGSVGLTSKVALMQRSLSTLPKASAVSSWADAAISFLNHFRGDCPAPACAWVGIWLPQPVQPASCCYTSVHACALASFHPASSVQASMCC
eukprot:1150340-Pelagomonas_calceolata.AAC.6